MPAQTEAPRSTATARLQRAINDHDLAAMVACFAPDYQSEFPVHPDRSFTGQARVEQNWAQIFAATPDLHAELLRETIDGETVWSEWEWRGTRPDGVPVTMRGVTIQGVQQDRIAWARLYMEPVQAAADGNSAAIRQIMGEGARV